MTTKIKYSNENYIIFEVKSNTRNKRYEVIFNRETGEWSCECEDYWYRKRTCKHTKECKSLLNTLIFECSSSKAFQHEGETLTSDEIRILS